MPRLPLFLLLASSYSALAAATAWREVPGGRIAPLSPAGRGEGFTALEAASLGLAWTNRLPVERYAQRQNLMNGSGLAAADVDGDGWPDLFFAGKSGGSALFRNLGGWRFTNITEQAGVALPNQFATGAVFADVNGDGRPDLFVTSFNGPDALLLNLGEGRFTNVTAAAGVTSPGGSTSAAFADLNGDGHLDLYVCRFGVEAILRDGATVTTRTVGGRTVVTGRFARRLVIEGGRIMELGEPDALYLNDGQGRFRPAVWREHFVAADGKPFEQAPPDFGLAVQIRDINGDGHPDIYVCNDFQTPDRLWLGDGRGRFREAPPLTVRNMAYASMGVDFADIDRDGRLDFIAVEMLSRDPARHLRQSSPMSLAERRAGDPWYVESFPRNVLQWNRGDGTYAEIAWFAGVAASDWSWTPVFLDVDLDGFEDLLVSNGHLHDVNDRDVNAARAPEGPKSPREAADILLRYPRLDTPNVAWRNRGDLTFEDRAAAWGFQSTVITHGLALADLDGDGDLDVIGNGHNSPPLLYRNEATAPRVAVRLRGRPGNPTGVGAVIRVTGGPGSEQQQEMLAGGRYLSADEPLRVFAAGAATNRLTVRVDWPGGRRSVLRDVPANSLVEVAEAAAGEAPARPPAPPVQPWFVAETDLPSALLHTPATVDDFARQTLLPRRLSHTGPALAAFDLDDDERDELVFSPGAGQSLVVARRGPDGGWSAASWPLPADHPAEEVTGLAGVADGAGRRWLAATFSRFTRGTNGPAAAVWPVQDGRPGAPVLLLAPAASPATPVFGDFNGDGEPDLFLGGRLVPGRYPEPADAAVYLHDGGRWTFDAARSAALRGLGLVTGAVLADLDGDGRSELVAATEWGPVRVFDLRGDAPRERTAEFGLAPHTGLWQSLAAADLDGDGRVDLVAGNWGRNSSWQRAPTGPWRLWHADFDGDGVVTVIEAYPRTDGAFVPVRGRDELAAEMPWLTGLFPTHAAFAAATVPQMLGEHAPPARHLEAHTLDTVVFWNRGGQFVPAPLPPPAQWTPVNAIAVLDADGDGRPDLFLAQNILSVRENDDRLDAGFGLLLRNEGGGGWTPLEAAISGLRLPGEQRGAAVGHFSGDGRPGLAVGVNRGAAALFHPAVAVRP